VRKAIELGERGQAPRFLMLSQLTQALLSQAQGDQVAALDAIVKVKQLVQTYSLPLAYLGRLVEVQARLALMQGDLASASQWAETSDLRVDDDLDYLHERQHMALARVLIAQDEAASAADLLARLRRSAAAGGRIRHEIEILSLEALAFQAGGAISQALIVLEQALELGQPEGYIRTFVDAGAPMLALLHAAQVQRIAPSYVEMLISAFARTEGRGLRAEATDARTEGRGLRNESVEPNYSVLSPQSASLAKPLTTRELEVLRLLAVGASTSGIALRLTLSPGTVKKHVNNILGKMHVHNRIHAIARARELHLLD
jgi:LuxR family maltose regulon positive regulatory protein